MTNAEPTRGQVWRARWDTVTLLVMLWTVEADHVTAIPVTVDTAMADDFTVVVDGPNGFGPAAVWVNLETPLGWHTLDVCWGSLPTDEVARIRGAYRAGEPVDRADLHTGARIVDPFDDRYEYRAVLGETINLLATAEWLPATGTTTLNDLVTAAGLDLAEVLPRIGLPAAERLRFLRGQRPVRSDEAHRLAPILGVDAATVLATNPPLPPQLVAAISRPRWRSEVSRAARDTGLAEAEARRKAAYAVLGLAARQDSGDSSEASWHQRLEHYFAS